MTPIHEPVTDLLELAELCLRAIIVGILIAGLLVLAGVMP